LRSLAVTFARKKAVQKINNHCASHPVQVGIPLDASPKPSALETRFDLPCRI
jgi:hypothetical protein